jgi:hypothetical protein
MAKKPSLLKTARAKPGRKFTTSRGARPIAARPANPPTEPGPREPGWLRAGSSWDHISSNVKQAVLEILVAAHRHMILDAPNEVERSAGATVMYLLWLEMCDQVYMAEGAADHESIASILDNPEQLINRYQRLPDPKNNIAELLSKLMVLREILGRRLQAQMPASAVVSAPAS